MMNDKSNSSYDKFNWWIKNNKVTASLIVIGSVIIALSTFTDAAKNLIDLLHQEKRAEINGIWTAEVTYDWAHATYTETFVFEGEGEDLKGTATFLKRKRIIQEGVLKNSSIEFLTKTSEISSSWNEGSSLESIHRYSGEINGNEIRFIMQTEGGYSLHTPIEFIAYKESAPGQ